MSTLVSEHNKKHYGLNVTMSMIQNIIKCLYSSETVPLASSTEEKPESDIETPRIFGRPKGTSYQEIRQKKDIRLVLVNEITNSYKFLKAEHAPKYVPPE